MGKIHERIDDRIRKFIAEQPMFFVATAPSEGGHVNVSPKGYAGTFAIIDDLTVAYLDLNGSGVETIAHLRDNGRITVMFCSFARNPNILRLYGQGRVVFPDSPEWDGLLAHFPSAEIERSFIVVDIERISDACGYAVPYMELAGERDMARTWAERKSPEDMAAYQELKNSESIDGLPGLTAIRSS